MTSLVEDWESDNFEVPQVVPKIVTANELLEKDINEMLEKKDQILGSFMQKVAFEPPVKAKNSSLREKPLRENRTSKFILTKQFSDSSLSSLVNAVQSTENISPIVCEIIVSQLSLLFMKFGNHVKNLSNYLQMEPLPFDDQIVHFYNLGGIQNHIDSIDTFFIQISHYFQDHSKSDHQFIKYLLEKIIIVDETIVYVERLFMRSVPFQELQNSYPPSFIYLMNECLLFNEFTKHIHLLSAEFLQMQLKLSSLSDVIDQEQELERMEPEEVTEATERIHQKKIVFFKRLRQSIFQERIILQNCFAVLFSYLSIYYYHHDEIQLAKQYSIKKEIPLEILQNLLFPGNNEEQEAKESGDRQDGEEEGEEDTTKGKENRKENHQKKQKKNSLVKCFQIFFELIAIFLQQEFFIAMQIAAENQWEFPPSLFHFMNFDTLLQPIFELDENDYDESRLSSFPLHYQPNDCSKGMLLRKLYLIRSLLFKFAKICSQESLPMIPMLQLDWAPWKCNKYCSLLSFSDSGSITILSYYVKYFFSIEKQQILQQIYEKLYHKNNNLKKIDSSSSNKVIIQEDYRMNPQIKELQLKNSILFHERMIDISSFFYIEKNNVSYLKLFRAIHTITKEIYQQFQQRISSSLPISIRLSLLNDHTAIIQPMSACFELIQFMIFQLYFIFPKISKSILSFYHSYFFSSSKNSSCYFLTTSQTKQQLQTILKLFEFLSPPPSNNHSRRIIPFILNDLNPYFGYYQKEISSIDYPFSLFSSISFPQWEKLCAERKAKAAELRWRSGSRRKYPSLEEEAELEADLRYGAAGENDEEEELEEEEEQEQEDDIWVNSERKDFGDEDHQDHSDGNYPQEKESSHYYDDYQQESNTIHQADESSQLDDF